MDAACSSPERYQLVIGEAFAELTYSEEVVGQKAERSVTAMSRPWQEIGQVTIHP
jgi:hypothetical protein